MFYYKCNARLDFGKLTKLLQANSTSYTHDHALATHAQCHYHHTLLICFSRAHSAPWRAPNRRYGTEIDPNAIEMSVKPSRHFSAHS